jgi:type II secretory ATPase GspE/PulE/Tfp pilus assembly ATPase PilB-like protein
MDQRLQIENCRLQIGKSIRKTKPSFNLQSAICNLKFLLTVVLVVSLPGLAAAGSDDASFPRGDGFYFNSIKLVTLVAAYLCWVATCRWVEQDATDLDLPVTQWSTLIFGAGFVGLIIIWLLPWYWISLLLLLILYASAALTYVNLRNQKVPAELRVLTTGHIQDLLQKYLRIRLGRGGDEETSNVAVEFIGKSRRGDEDTARVARVASSKGYRAAKEMVYEALQRRATDIHLEPTKQELTVRFRVDGILHAADPFSRTMGDAVLNIFKVLADLDITEKRKPQDGGLSARVSGKAIDFRVATSGSVVGEKMVMRILDKSQQIINLTQLGLRERLRDQINQVAQQPHGMLIVCGPTGAGKSTTLYACLNEIDRFQKNVITVENPVEYNIENVTQIEINPKAGKTFAGELRSILRQDPDVIYIGEVRDQETAEIACQAAMTGHMVFTTLHANDTVTALGRLIDLGVQPFMIADAVSAILGQRLVRLLCAKCKVRYKPNAELLRKANLPADKIKFFYRPPESANDNGKGDLDGQPEACPHCGGTGYFGRTGIFELLLITDRIRDMIRDNPNLNAIRQEAVKTGMKYLQEDGLRQVIEGKTSIQELLRVSK